MAVLKKHLNKVALQIRYGCIIIENYIIYIEGKPLS